MEKSNADIVCISKKVLLELLQFEGGIIHSIEMERDVWNPNEIQLVVEHPDLHEVSPGFILMRIHPTYTKHIEIVNGVEYSRIERINPPRKENLEDGQQLAP